MIDMSKRATYSRSAVNECVIKIKKLNKTVVKRIDHSVRMYEVKGVYDFCLEKTNCILFNYEYSVCHDYIKAWERKESKKSLDTLLRISVYDLQNHITDIIRDMETGEINVVA